MKFSEIQELIKFVSKSGVSEVEIEDKDFKINIKTPPYRKGKVGYEPAQVVHLTSEPAAQMQAAPAPAAPAAPAAPVEKKVEAASENYLSIKSPMIGTFYRKSSPDKPEFVKVGDKVSIGAPVCVIEAMKLFNEIESEVAGTIVKVLVDDSSPVEYDQPLFLVDPAG